MLLWRFRPVLISFPENLLRNITHGSGFLSSLPFTRCSQFSFARLSFLVLCFISHPDTCLFFSVSLFLSLSQGSLCPHPLSLSPSLPLFLFECAALPQMYTCSWCQGPSRNQTSPICCHVNLPGISSGAVWFIKYNQTYKNKKCRLHFTFWTSVCCRETPR